MPALYVKQLYYLSPMSEFNIYRGYNLKTTLFL
ncbi:hypothetical protein BZL35_00328 [Candidatus Pandoraea novymonadis]|uniref:Uncharacterized protein n=1 Tax=Candidatus Pandoraea novymonadis TaxID=1808959 RepID=A0ABX5FFH7_9BURK|nr:hypothetical protein BZL35_00328 [Candidatus Pandoraea novymonadis]